MMTKSCLFGRVGVALIILAWLIALPETVAPSLPPQISTLLVIFLCMLSIKSSIEFVSRYRSAIAGDSV